jgi:hypothetical protein
VVLEEFADGRANLLVRLDDAEVVVTSDPLRLFR